MTPLALEATDARLRPARAELADARLEGTVEATRFAEPFPGAVTASLLPLRNAPDIEAGVETELLFGEPVELLSEETCGGRDWAWLRSVDGYVGYVPSEGIGPVTPRATHRATHRVAVRFTHVYRHGPEGPTMKRPALRRLPLGARVTVTGPAAPLRGASGAACPIDGGGWIYERHLAPLEATEPDIAATASLFLGTPYLWGGRSGDGIDCSALVQLALDAAGLAVSRDTDMQEGQVTGAVSLASCGFVAIEARADLERNDIVFWPGHVGIMLDGSALLHANAHGMIVAAEPLTEVVSRLGAAGAPLASVWRRTA